MPGATVAFNTLGWTVQGIPGGDNLRVTDAGVPDKSATYPTELFFNQGNSGVPTAIVGGGQHVNYGPFDITYYLDAPDPCEQWFDECKNLTGEELDGKKVSLTVTRYEGTNPAQTWQFEQALPSAVGKIMGNSNTAPGLLTRTLTVVYASYDTTS